MCSRSPTRSAHGASGRSGCRPRCCHDPVGNPYAGTDRRARTRARPRARGEPDDGGRARQAALWPSIPQGCLRARNPRSWYPWAAHPASVRGSAIQQGPSSNVNPTSDVPLWLNGRAGSRRVTDTDFRECLLQPLAIGLARLIGSGRTLGGLALARPTIAARPSRRMPGDRCLPEQRSNHALGVRAPLPRQFPPRRHIARQGRLGLRPWLSNIAGAPCRDLMIAKG